MTEAKLILPEVNNYKSEIINIINSTNTEKLFPDYEVKILEGDNAGKIINTYSNGYKYEVGDKVFLEITKETDGSTYISCQFYFYLFIILSNVLNSWQ